MRRTLVALLGLAACAAAAAPAAAQDRPPLRAALSSCGTGAAEDDRYAVFTASMAAMRGTRRMAMRFDLFERLDGRRRWRPVRPRGFSRWDRSDPGRAGFVYTKRVERLKAGATYRAVVRFRWYREGGRVQRTALRRPAVCRQPDERPDLRVTGLEVLPGPDAGTARYRVVVVNQGRSAAGAFDVGLTVGGAAKRRSVAGLAAGQQTTLDLLAAACEGAEPVEATADAGNVVDESDERNNAYVRPCGGR
jgi:hypothetical protein